MLAASAHAMFSAAITPSTLARAGLPRCYGAVTQRDARSARVFEMLRRILLMIAGYRLPV